MMTHSECVGVCVFKYFLSICSQELFCVCGALKRARLVKVGVAEVVFVRKEDAVSAYRKYNNRCLDGECWWQGHKHEIALWVLGFVFCFALGQ